MNTVSDQEVIFFLLRRKLHLRQGVLTTGDMSSSLNVSQQTASRWLISLAKRGFIARNGSHVMATDKAVEYTRNVLNAALEALGSPNITFKGTIAEASEFILPKTILARFTKKFFKPTKIRLKVFIKDEDIEKRLEIRQKAGIKVRPGLEAYPCKINGSQAALLFAEEASDGLRTLVVVFPIEAYKKIPRKSSSEVTIEVI